MGCLFCRIAEGEIPSSKVYEDEDMLAFRDINPEAEVHVLVIPKQHIGCLDDICPENAEIIRKIFLKIPEIARAAGCENGYRLISNCGPDAGQSVPHLHFHILGGEVLPLHIRGN